MTDLPAITVDAHPSLDAVGIVSFLPAPLGELRTPAALAALFLPGAAAPMQSGPDVIGAVRDLLRQGGFKPSGRSKPASEYLAKAVLDGRLSPDKLINPVVDALNAVSLYSGLPISVVDLDLAQGPHRIACCAPGSRYAFNASGQEIDLGGLLCLYDAVGPCANAVKDSQRTKTHPGSQRVLTIIWGTHELPGRSQASAAWYRALLSDLGARSEDIELLRIAPQG